MEYSDVIEIRECATIEEANTLIRSEDACWILLGVANGQTENHAPVFKYSVGRKGRSLDAISEWAKNHD